MKLKTATLSLLAGAASLSAVGADEKTARKPAPKLVPKPTCELPIQIDHKALFKIADANKDGTVTLEEFSRAYRELEKKISAALPKPPAPARPQLPVRGLDPCPTCGLG